MRAHPAQGAVRARLPRSEHTAANISRACARRCFASFFETRRGRRFVGEVCGKSHDGRPLASLDVAGSRVLLPEGFRAQSGDRVEFAVLANARDASMRATAVRRLGGKAEGHAWEEVTIHLRETGADERGTHARRL